MNRREFLKALAKGVLASHLLGGAALENRTMAERFSVLNVRTDRPLVKKVTLGDSEVYLIGVKHEGPFEKPVVDILKNISPDHIVGECCVLEKVLDYWLRENKQKKGNALAGIPDFEIFDPESTLPRQLAGIVHSLDVVSALTLLSAGSKVAEEKLTRRQFLKKLLRTVYGLSILGLLELLGQAAYTALPSADRGRELGAYLAIHRALGKGKKKIAVVAGAAHVPGIERLLKDPGYRAVVKFFWERALKGART